MDPTHADQPVSAAEVARALKGSDFPLDRDALYRLAQASYPEGPVNFMRYMAFLLPRSVGVKRPVLTT